MAPQTLFWLLALPFELSFFGLWSMMCNALWMVLKYGAPKDTLVKAATDGIQIFLPFLLALYELSTKDQNLSSKSLNSYSYQFLTVVLVWAFSAYGTIAFSTQYSTYICALQDGWSKTIKLWQCFGLLLDAVIISRVVEMFKNSEDSGKPWRKLGQLSLMSAGALTALVSMVLLLSSNSNKTGWSLRSDFRTIASLVYASFLGSNLVGSAVYLMSEIRSTTIVTIGSGISLYVSQCLAWHFQASIFYRRFSSGLAVASVISFIAAAGFVRIERDASRSKKHLSLSQSSSRMLTALYILLTLVFCGTKVLQYAEKTNLVNHPIDILLSIARYSSDRWQKQAKTSGSLEEAVVAYQARYGIPPPPNFDIWYRFAIERASEVIDDFDQIHKDLLPFWGVEPAIIRELTGHILERPWTAVAGIRISNGTTTIGPHMPGTHRWMMDGTVSIINKFSKWLPDMDLGFNINDECRVAVPWMEMETLKQTADLARRSLNQTKAVKGFSADTIWQGGFMESEPVYSPDTPSEYFTPFTSSMSSFVDFATIACPPDSSAHTQNWWNKKAFCNDCSAPHSLGPFVLNWDISSTPCHQPDMRHLHGFYLSPAAFLTAKTLLPIFSQSKVPTFSDILFPSPWNYMDKVSYNASADMAFSEKESSLFWRGATSEGFAIEGTWRGMQRQRFVHLANNTPNSTTVELFQPPNDPRKQRPASKRSVAEVTKIDVAFVDKPTRCHSPDCALQASEFAWSTPVNFDEHWRHKYLFDLDGAGFSGRFLPFLQSHSLVFRVAAFRQWFEGRLTPWKHFVPVDSRMSEVWSLLAYFGGTGKGLKNGHEVEAEMIAKEGREWAGKVLRKEDMEIYMFRLLLEWGRVVDDRRHEIGFVLP